MVLNILVEIWKPNERLIHRHAQFNAAQLIAGQFTSTLLRVDTIRDSNFSYAKLHKN